MHAASWFGKLLQSEYGLRTFLEPDLGKLTHRIVESQPIPAETNHKVSVDPSFKGIYPIPSLLGASWFGKLLHRRDGF